MKTSRDNKQTVYYRHMQRINFTRKSSLEGVSKQLSYDLGCPLQVKVTLEQKTS